MTDKCKVCGMALDKRADLCCQCFIYYYQYTICVHLRLHQFGTVSYIYCKYFDTCDSNFIAFISEQCSTCFNAKAGHMFREHISKIIFNKKRVTRQRNFEENFDDFLLDHSRNIPPLFMKRKYKQLKLFEVLS